MDNQQEMKQVSVMEILKEHNLVVPEIQREYVWGRNDYGILDTFLTDIKHSFNNKLKENPELKALEKLLMKSSIEERLILESLAEKLNGQTSEAVLNLGFLYSYKPGYYISDEGKDAYLIDGQQRFTTLFLILFYLAVKENKIETFKKLFRVKEDENKIAFNYRVRMLTHNFILDMLSNVKSVADLIEIKSKSWFLANYKHDTTVSAIVGTDKIDGALFLIHQHLNDQDHGLFEFAQQNIKFWHFKTEETSQGEELYITMNSRGQQLADNESVRAVLFKSESAKKDPMKWSELWEEWQDFFWKNASTVKNNSGLSADLGFNEFLRWVQIFKMIEIKQSTGDDENEDAADKKDILKVIRWGKWEKLDTAYLELEQIELYFNALKYLYTDFKKELHILDSHYKEYKNFNLLSHEWLHPKESVNNIGQIDSFRLLPVLYYCKMQIENKNKLSIINVFRVIRFFFNISRDPNINKSPGNQLINAIKALEKTGEEEDIAIRFKRDEISSTLLNKEERIKLKLFSEAEDRYSLENFFWRGEDLRVNSGQIKHLLDLSFAHSSPNNFEIEIFADFLKTFEEFIKNEKFIWGNLLPTDVYLEKADRIFALSSWYKTKDFMELVSLRTQKKNQTLIDFFQLKKKEFIKQYTSAEMLFNEKSYKKQLYLYYILHTELIARDQNWNWDHGWAFGVWSNYPHCKSIFNTPSVFQHYSQAFRENENKIVKVHRKIPKGEKLIEDLMIWSET
ncbi:hypothetical protein DBR27_17865 [Flavobacterium sp. HMWF030]|nr:hypothetical protein DBR27_17865 [Flavobacterium sp. HMWF030]